MADLPQIWKTDHVRVTLFSRDVWSVDQTAFVSKFAGVEVDSTSSRPAMAEAVTRAHLDATRTLEVKQQINRLDFMIQVRQDQVSLEGPPLLDDVVEQARVLVDWTSNWLATERPELVVRVAIGAGAMLPTSDKVSSYKKLGELLPMMQLDPVRHQDFQLRLNTPTSSKVIDGLSVNAMATWSSIRINVGFFGPVPEAANLPMASEKHYVFSVLDVNTDPYRNEPIPADSLVPLLSEAQDVFHQLLRGAK